MPKLLMSRNISPAPSSPTRSAYTSSTRSYSTSPTSTRSTKRSVSSLLSSLLSRSGSKSKRSVRTIDTDRCSTPSFYTPVPPHSVLWEIPPPLLPVSSSPYGYDYGYGGQGTRVVRLPESQSSSRRQAKTTLHVSGDAVLKKVTPLRNKREFLLNAIATNSQLPESTLHGIRHILSERYPLVYVARTSLYIDVDDLPMDMIDQLYAWMTGHQI
ncbi:hypothetical protein FRB99_002541 [Tulasnella sp. 403]|nr:hypothetical protein FRB99_002541 [Tulasnella sp. 403]